MMDHIPNFTPQAQQAIQEAKYIAGDLNWPIVQPDHLLLGLLRQERGLLREAFYLSGNDLDAFKAFVESSLKSRQKPAKNIKFSAEIKNILEAAHKFSMDSRHFYVGTEHILLSLLKSPSSRIQELFDSSGVRKRTLVAALRSELTDSNNITPEEQSLAKLPSEPRKKEPSQILEAFAVNYNELAATGKFDDVLCDQESLDLITESLCRKSKNNPLLLGEPGIGKTALIEGLAKRIVNSECSEYLLSHKIFGLDLASMIAGTKYRGQFEERLKKLLKELQQIPNLVLFIDEIHTLVGAGSAEGSMDAANILKPALARGEILCVGATTLGEYKNTIEKDGALARRFQPIFLHEPSQEHCKNILKSIQPTYEKFHSVNYSSEAVDACVELSTQFIHDRQLPDKAIDLLDQAGSKVKIANFKRPKSLKYLENKLQGLIEAEALAKTPKRRSVIVEAQNEVFAEYLKKADAWGKRAKGKVFNVTESDIQSIIAEKIGVPMDQVSSSFSEKLLTLEDKLNNLVIGQPDVAKSLAECLIRKQSGLAMGSSPIGSFLLLGSSGTGKTHTAKTLAHLLFGSKDNFININMSEYSDSFTSSKLIGAAPGYVGFDQAGQLTEAVRRHPYSVVLFDEIEKAHDNVIQILLQILDEGTIKDSSNRLINFSNCVIIITGNIGAEFTKGQNSVGFGAAGSSNHEDIKERVLAASQKTLRPEFLNRLDEVVVFNNFSDDSFGDIISLKLKELQKNLKQKGVSSSFYKNLRQHILKVIIEKGDGARPIDHVIQSTLMTPIAKRFLSREKDWFSRVVGKMNKDEVELVFS